MYYMICDTCCGEISNEIAITQDAYTAIKFICDSFWQNPYPYEELIIRLINEDRGKKLYHSCKIRVI